MTGIIDKEKYRQSIVALWSDCFGDDAEYVSFFLDNCPHICIGTFSEGKLVSMLFLLDGFIDKYKVKYIYAACTDKEYRGRGLMAQLINFSEKFCIEKDFDGLFLVPAEETLYGYYKKFGFISCFEKSEFILNKSQCDRKIEFKETGAEEASEIRQRLLNKNSFYFEDKTNLYAIREHLYCGGDILYSKNNDNETLCFVCKDNDKIFITEFLAKNPVKKFKISSIFEKYHIENIYIHAPIVYNNTNIGVFRTKCGMCLPVNPDFQHFISDSKQLYAGLYLD